MIYTSRAADVLGLLPWARDACDLDELRDISEERLPYKAVAAFPKNGRPREWGKGRSLEDASASALMERIERYIAANAHLIRPDIIRPVAPRHIGIRHETIFSLTPTNVTRFLVDEADYNETTSDFIACREFPTGQQALIPASRVLLGHHDKRFHDFGDSTGLAAGGNRDEALLQAIFEVYERDIFHRLVFGPALARRSVSCDETGALIDPQVLKEIGTTFDLEIAEVLHHAPCHVVLVRLFDKTRPSGALLSQLHVGVSVTLAGAVNRAISESVQSHLIDRFRHNEVQSAPRYEPHDLLIRQSYDASLLASSAGGTQASNTVPTGSGHESHRWHFHRMASYFSETGGRVYTYEFPGTPDKASVVRVIVTNAAPNFMVLGYYPTSFKARVGSNLSIAGDVYRSVERGAFQEQVCFAGSADGTARAIPPISVSLPPSRVSLQLHDFRQAGSDLSLQEALRRRKSGRSARQLVDLPAIAAILLSGAGFRGLTFDPNYGVKQKRSYGSPGACHSLEYFVAARGAEGCPTGIYFFANMASTLEKIAEARETQAFFEQFNGVNQWASDAKAVIVAVSLPARLRFKYGANSERFAHQEYGHASGYFALLAESLEISLTQIGTCACEPAIAFLRRSGVSGYVIGGSALI